MIKEVHLHNWKSFGDAVFYIDPLTAVIGTNSSGKSNLLDALVFLKELASGLSIDNVAQKHGTSKVFDWIKRDSTGRGAVTVIIEVNSNIVLKYTIAFRKNTPKNVVELVEESVFELKENGNIRKIFDYIPYTSFFKNGERRNSIKSSDYIKNSPIFTLVANRSLYQDKPGSLSDSDYNSLYEMTDIFHNISFIDPIPQNMRDYASVSSQIEPNTSNIAGVLASFPDNEKAEIENRLSQYMSKIPEKDLVKVTAEKVGKLGKDAMLYCEENWNNQEEPTIIDASTMSDGTLRFLAIVATLLISKEGSLILIEEVDNGLHPSRAEYLIKVLLELGREKKIDIVFTTHNPALLDALGTEMIPFISVVHRNPTTGNSEITLLEDIEQLPKLMASGSIGKLASQGKIEESLRHQTQDKMISTRKVLIIDTSILCVWLKVPSMTACVSNSGTWDFERVNAKIQEEEKNKTTFVLPLATIIETGNHISQANGDVFNLAQRFCELLRKTANEETPWSAFSRQDELWTKEKLIELSENWPKSASRKISIGDFTIKDVANYYSKLPAKFEVEIFTGDSGLKAYEVEVNERKAQTPRREKK